MSTYLINRETSELISWPATTCLNDSTLKKHRCTCADSSEISLSSNIHYQMIQREMNHLTKVLAFAGENKTWRTPSHSFLEVAANPESSLPEDHWLRCLYHCQLNSITRTRLIILAMECSWWKERDIEQNSFRPRSVEWRPESTFEIRMLIENTFLFVRRILID